jgi:hypothetical protein
MKLAMRIGITTALVIVQLLTFCKASSDSKGQGLEVIDVVSGLKDKRVLHISSFTEDVQYIPLSGSEMPYIRGINLLGITNNYMLISDMLGCYLFDTSGQFIRSIGVRGRGPGEFPSIGQIAIGEDKRVFILSLKVLNEYNIKGIFQGSVDFYDSSSPQGYLGNWLYLNNGTFLAQVRNDTGSEKYKAVVLNTQGAIIAGFQNFILFAKDRSSAASVSGISSAYYFNDSIRYKELFNDTLFSLVGGTNMIPLLRFNLGSYKADYMEFSNDLLGRAKFTREWARINDVFETSQFLFFDLQTTLDYLKRPEPFHERGFDFDYYTTRMLGIYDKTKRETSFVDITRTDEILLRTGIFNDIDGGPKFLPRFRMGENKFAMPIDAFELKRYIKSESFRNAHPKYPEKKKALEELVNSLKEDSNPVLMVVTMK